MPHGMEVCGPDSNEVHPILQSCRESQGTQHDANQLPLGSAQDRTAHTVTSPLHGTAVWERGPGVGPAQSHLLSFHLHTGNSP